MKKLKSLFIVTFLLSLCALCFAACDKPKALPQISAPTNLRREENFLVWNSVEGATGYTVDVNGATYELTDTRYDLAAIVEPDSYIIKIQAKGDGVTFADSTWATVAYNYATNFVFAEIDDGSAYEVSGILSLTNNTAKIPSQYKSKPVTAIGAKAFKGNKDLIAVTIPDSVTVIKNGAFHSCTALKSVSLPNGLTEIGSEAFRQCSELNDLSLPNGLQRIGNSAFYLCSKLDVSIPETVTYLGNSAFFSTAITIARVPNGVTEIENTFADCKSLKEVTLPDGLTRIGQSTFSSCAELKTLTVPESVGEIGKHAFFGCTLLQSVRLPQGLTEIAPELFWRCPALTSINVPQGITEIGMQAFRDCPMLSELDLPATVERIGENAFLNCAWLDAQPDGPVYVGKVFLKYQGEIPENTELTVRAGTVSVAPKACLLEAPKRARITKLTLPEGLEIIGSSAFFKTEITELILPQSLITLEESSFAQCGNLNELTIPKSVKNIMELALPSRLERVYFEDPSGWLRYYSSGASWGDSQPKEGTEIPTEIASDPEKAAALFETLTIGYVPYSPVLYKK